MDIAIAREAAFAVHDDAFLDVLGSDPRLELVLETDAHERPKDPHNLAWGDADARGLSVTARTSVYRIAPAIPGIRPL
jgi:hypothetical protein